MESVEENKLKENKINKKTIILFVIAFSIVIVIAGVFYIGAAYSCRNSNGELIGGLLELKCNNIDIIGVCEYGDKLLIPPNESSKYGFINPNFIGE